MQRGLLFRQALRCPTLRGEFCCGVGVACRRRAPAVICGGARSSTCKMAQLPSLRRHQANGPSAATPEEEQMVNDFAETLRDPDDIWIRGSEARKKFDLTREDMRTLPFVKKENAFDATFPHFKLYEYRSVVETALKKHGEQKLLQHYALRYLPMLQKAAIYGDFRPDHEEVSSQGLKGYWYTAPSSQSAEGRRSVEQGLKANLAICTVKGTVWFVTGSHAIFADWMHSIADVANYGYRFVQLQSSAKQRDVTHPYGYAPLRYITADRSFVFLGFVGGVYPFLSGLRELTSEVPMCDHFLLPAGVFVVSALLELTAVIAAYREIQSQAAKELKSRPGKAGDSPQGGLRSLIWYFREGRDVMSTATFTEASSGVLGAGIGLLGLGASWLVQDGLPDVVASIGMSCMVCGVSFFLLRKSGIALLGQTLPAWRVKQLIHKVESHPAVVHIFDVKTEMVGYDTVRFKGEVQFNAPVITERILSGVSVPSTAETPIADSEVLSGHAVVAHRLQDILPELAIGRSDMDNERWKEQVTSWLCRNNNLFYEALAWEVKDVERILRENLKEDGFKHVHIDLEPW
mmetsp:Transcript_7860/g.18343  ORF Transcript_7860/g.18343 Transcript_7860/m.18343 type:complete len:575 (-) Transcript_7860:28-1752(-)